jgi:hypothetical protein
MSRAIDPHPAIGIRVEEQLEMIADSDLEADRYLGDVDITGIAVKVAVCNTESELSAPKRLAIINGEESRRSSRRTSRAYGRSNVPWIIVVP